MGSAMPPKEPELSAAPPPAERGAPTDHLRHAVEHAAHLLPAQGPITVFIHHNTLHAFEHLSFEQAVRRGAEVFGCQPYLPEERYRAALGRGRIRLPELRAVLADDLGTGAGQTVAGLCTRMELRLAMLESPVVTAPADELTWFMAETDALTKVRREAFNTTPDFRQAFSRLDRERPGASGYRRPKSCSTSPSRRVTTTGT